MLLRDGLFGPAEVGDHLPGPPGQAAGDGLGLDPPGLIPGDPEQVGSHLDGTLPKQVDGEPFEPGGELAAQVPPGDRQLLDPVGLARDPGDLRLGPGGELAGIQTPPAAGLLIVPRHLGLALRAGERARPRVYPDDHLLPLHVQVHADHRPGRGEAQDCPVQLDIAHGSGPPFRGGSIAQVGSITHTIS